MTEIRSWMKSYAEKAEETFAGRIRFIGLQGSYGREEASENSDIDVVLILDRLDAEDLKKYSDMLDTRRESWSAGLCQAGARLRTGRLLTCFSSAMTQYQWSEAWIVLWKRYIGRMCRGL